MAAGSRRDKCRSPDRCHGRGAALTTAPGGCIGRELATRDAGMMPLLIAAPCRWKLHGLTRFAPALRLAR